MENVPPAADGALAAAAVPGNCNYCKTAAVPPDGKFCTACGYPQAGTQEEQDAFAYKKARSKFAKETQREQVTKARNTLYWVAGLNMLPYLLTGEPAAIIAGLVISLIFVGLALWSRQKPFPALLTALIVFVALNLLLIIGDLSNIYRGLILKVIVLSALIYALRSLKRDDLPADH
jgi:hypothetical protein